MPKEVKQKLRLSKSVLEMKFMKRSKLKAQAEEDAKESSAMYSRNITEGMKNAVESYVFEPSYIPFENLIVGRLSFGGMNPEVEKLMAGSQRSMKKVSHDMEKEISDIEMANYRTGLSQTLAKKFSYTTNQRKKNNTTNQRKKKFLKPQDEI